MNAKQCGNVFETTSLDNILNNNEARDVNDFYGIYKISHCILSGSGGGKSTFAIQQILSGVYNIDRLFIVAAEETLTSGIMASFIARLSISPKWEKKLFVYNLSVGMPSFESIKSKTKGRSLLLMDDWISICTPKDLKVVHRLLMNGSRLSLDMLLLVQNFSKIPPNIFQNFTLITIFPNFTSKSQIKAICTHRSSCSLSSKQIDTLISYARQQGKHSYITINNLASIGEQIRVNNEFLTFE